MHRLTKRSSPRRGSAALVSILSPSYRSRMVPAEVSQFCTTVATAEDQGELTPIQSRAVAGGDRRLTLTLAGIGVSFFELDRETSRSSFGGPKKMTRINATGKT
jgi:hypothetical protein